MVIDTALPWDLSLRIAGEEFKTRPLRVVDVAGLSRFDKLTDEEGFTLLGGLFAKPEPDLKAMSEAGKIGALELLGIAQAFSKYFEGQVEKNSLAIVEQIKTTMATPKIST